MENSWEPSLKFFNKGLDLIVVGLVFYLLLYSLVWGKREGNRPLLKESGHTQIMSPIESFPEPKPLGYYLSAIEQRSIFQSLEDLKVADAQAAGQAAAALIAHFKIVGIMMDEQPIVIIEDAALHQTLFLSKGDTFNGAVVESINEENVQFNYQGQIVTLNP